MKKLGKRILITAIATMVLLTGCGAKESTQTTAGEKTNIVYAKGPGPYSELFEDAIIPILEKKGYTFNVTELDLSQADAALTSGDVDVSVEQHKAYMDAFNEQSGGNLVALSRIPTVPATR